jgi:uncharacterized protein YndB with AHSA1/START domain
MRRACQSSRCDTTLIALEDRESGALYDQGWQHERRRHGGDGERAVTRTFKEVTMWATEHSVEATAPPEQIWRLWADVAGWPEWNGDIERIELIGPFAAGSRIVMTPVGDEAIELRIAEAVEPELFVDEADMGEIVVRTIHRVGHRLGPSTVTYRMEITGPAADTLGPQIGPEISGDFPQILAALAARAAS